jgi:hypothetical protein
VTAAAVAAPLALKAVNVEAPPRAVRIGGAAEGIVQDESDSPSGPIIDINEARDGRGNIGPAPDSAPDDSQNTETVGDVARSPSQGRSAGPKPTSTVDGDLTEDSSASAASSETPVEEPATTLGSIGESTLTIPPEPYPTTPSSAPSTTGPTTTTTVPTTPTSTSTTDGPEATVSIPTTTTSSGQTGSYGSTRPSFPTGND